MNSQSQVNPMIDKLRKLIAHEQSARSIGNLEEAEAFAAKIQNLLTAHKLSMSEIDFQAREDGEPIDWEEVNASDIGTRSKKFKVWWRVIIAKNIAKINSCQVVRGRRNNFFFVGRTSDRELAKILYIYLVELGEELCSKAERADREIQKLKFNVKHGINSFSVPDWARAAFSSWMKSYRESWKNGFAEAIAKRMEDQYNETLKAQAQTSANAIVHIKRDALAVEEYLKGKTQAGRGRINHDKSNADGYARGQSTGNSVNLSPHRFEGATGRSARLLGA